MNYIKKDKKYYFNAGWNKKYIYIYIYFFLASSYSTQPKIAAYCSSKAKFFSYAFTIVEQFLYFNEAKIAI